MRKVLLWTLTIVITVSTMIYQKMTGPTYPKKVNIELAGVNYDFNLLRTNEIGSPCDINLPIEDKSVEAHIFFKRYKVNEEWQDVKMERITINKKAIFGKDKKIEVLSATLPEQPAAGKVEYHIELFKGDQKVEIAKETPVVVRFKGFVPRHILIPHVIFMIFALLFGTRAGVETIFRRKKTLLFTSITLIVLGIGGLILGPIVQEYAFGDYWTGWPFGGDWTDNKTLFAFIFWLIAFFVLRKKPQNRLWPIIALLVFYTIYLIPHSTGGSELNAETGQVETGIK